jgi:hypothetical protein
VLRRAVGGGRSESAASGLTVRVGWGQTVGTSWGFLGGGGGFSTCAGRKCEVAWSPSHWGLVTSQSRAHPALYSVNVGQSSQHISWYKNVRVLECSANIC